MDRPVNGGNDAADERISALEDAVALLTQQVLQLQNILAAIGAAAANAYETYPAR